MFAAPERAGYGATMRIAALLVSLVGCHTSGGDDYHVISGGDDHPINPMVDAKPADGVVVDGSMLVGRVCVVTDVRTPTVGCATTGAANITVTLGTETTMTADDGSFMLMPPSGAGLVWHTSGTNLVSSVIPLTTSNFLPMVSVQTYLDLENGNSVIVNSGQGSVFLYVRQTALPLADATTEVSPPGSFLTLGDRANATNWVQGATGALGVSWTPGIDVGPATLTVTPPVGTAAMIDVPVEDGAITFATLVIP
jgi:hypothetical protein